MTYAMAWALQRALYDRLTSDAGAVAHLDGRVWDGAPPFEGPADEEGPWAIIGDERSDDLSSQDGRGASHLVSITVCAAARGFAPVKRAAAAVSDAILGEALTLERGRVILTSFVDARTGREERDALRTVTLRFRILTEES